MGNSSVKPPPSDRQPKAAGRPSIFTTDLGLEICRRIANGQSLRRICESNGMPGKSTVLQWLIDPQSEELKAFADQYARARDAQADMLADEIIEISDDGSRDYKTAPEGTALVDHDHISRSRLRVDSRKWFASKVAPKKYGDRIIAEHGGGDGKPIEIRHVVSWLETSADSTGDVRK